MRYELAVSSVCNVSTHWHSELGEAATSGAQQNSQLAPTYMYITTECDMQVHRIACHCVPNVPHLEKAAVHWVSEPCTQEPVMKGAHDPQRWGTH